MPRYWLKISIIFANQGDIKMRMNVILTIVLIVGLLILSAPLVSAKTIALWLCDEGNGQTLKDSSGNGHDGVFEGKVAWAEGNPGPRLRWGAGPEADRKNGRKRGPSPGEPEISCGGGEERRGFLKGPGLSL